MIKNLIKKIFSKIYGDSYDVYLLRKSGALIGQNFYCDNSYIDGNFRYLIEIGDNVGMTHAAILAHDASTKIPLRKSKIGKVYIGNNVFIGYGTIILPNVKIGSQVVIGAGSVVNHDIPDNSVAAGNPCRVISSYESFVAKNQLHMQDRPVFGMDGISIPPSEISVRLGDSFGYTD